jgi:hypothetical protein
MKKRERVGMHLVAGEPAALAPTTAPAPSLLFVDTLSANNSTRAT